MKIQRLIEEIPTIEQLKKSSFDIYHDFKCVFCKKKKEDFNHHVWSCRYNRKRMKQIISRTIKKFVSLLEEFNIMITNEQILTINNLDIFKQKFNTNNFNFIDLIKGIIPVQIYNLTLEILGTNQVNKAKEIGINLLQYVFKETKEHIWQPRCEELKKIEKIYGITKEDKKKPDSVFLKEK
ncbi:hypothetical protein RhiirA4_462518 [Rhizophagus irregularis]|uniref:Uncharacterized protein n=1 Tax=Rhizophagus irregularis TaxID=588596 RepID=A0A2I1GL44_9GLOM|nr:hypothetical protein RhiirA4_462518 [Rhizophagus irregularis]